MRVLTPAAHTGQVAGQNVVRFCNSACHCARRLDPSWKLTVRCGCTLQDVTMHGVKLSASVHSNST